MVIRHLNFLSSLRALQGCGDHIAQSDSVSLGLVSPFAYPGSTSLTSSGSWPLTLKSYACPDGG